MELVENPTTHVPVDIKVGINFRYGRLDPRMHARHHPDVYHRSQEVLSDMMEETKEYCHDVADKSKEIEDLIIRRELQDAWTAHDRQCAADGDGVTPAMRQTKSAIQQLEQRLLNRISELECCDGCGSPPASKKRRGEMHALQGSSLGPGIPPMEELKAQRKAIKDQLHQGIAVLNRIQWGMSAVWDEDEVGISINLDRTPDAFFYDYDSENTTATKESHRKLIHSCRQFGMINVTGVRHTLAALQDSLYQVGGDMKQKMAHMYKELIDKIRTNMPLHRLSSTKTVMDSAIGITVQIESMEDHVFRQQIARVSNSSKSIYDLCQGRKRRKKVAWKTLMTQIESRYLVVVYHPRLHSYCTTVRVKHEGEVNPPTTGTGKHR